MEARFSPGVLVALGSTALAAPVPKEVRKADSLDGLWEITSMEVFGQPKAGPKQRWKIGDGAITVEQIVPNAAARIRPPIRIGVDAGASPKALDYNVQGPVARPAIYEVDGDTLKILMATPGAGRPKAMKSDESTVLYVFKRVKD